MKVVRKILLIGLFTASLQAESGYDAWLRYDRVNGNVTVPAVVTAMHDSELLRSARAELIRGLRGMTGSTLRSASGMPKEDAIILTTFGDLESFGTYATLQDDGFILRTLERSGLHHIVIAAPNDRGVLYGAFALLRKIALGESIANLNEKQEPRAPIRWVNHWDNLDGTIERGYGGRSIFWDNVHVPRRSHARRATTAACWPRSASTAAPSTTSTPTHAFSLRISCRDRARSPTLPALGRAHSASRSISAARRRSADSTRSIRSTPESSRGGRRRPTRSTARCPDLAGFIIKADSEGRVGPSAYGRTHADAANVVARALKPHGGLIFYRGFVYDHQMDWRNPKNDRARAAYDNFRPLDGKFDDNVIIQIKHGPIDFQVREPASPLFGALEKTKQAIELQITQEYFGQAGTPVFLVPMWKEALDFDLQRRADARTPVKSRVRWRFVGVSNVGLDDNWLGNHLSQANLYGFGRLAWNPDLSAQADRRGMDAPDLWHTIPRSSRRSSRMQLTSWRTYENYTGPLGLQTLTDIVGNHYGVAVEASERNGWGQWHRADEQGVGHGSHRRHRHRVHRPVPSRRGARCTNRSRPVRTICCSSCITCRTRTSCIPARP